LISDNDLSEMELERHIALLLLSNVETPEHIISMRFASPYTDARPKSFKGRAASSASRHGFAR
jgi:hypothetical protein